MQPDASTDPLNAQLIMSSSTFACEPENLPAPHPTPFVLLAFRGNCTFAQKTRNAAAAGASALIVANSLYGIYQSASTGTVGLPLNTTACSYDCSLGVAWVNVSVNIVADHSTDFGFCENSMREKDWRCRKRGTQATWARSACPFSCLA